MEPQPREIQQEITENAEREPRNTQRGEAAIKEKTKYRGIREIRGKLIEEENENEDENLRSLRKLLYIVVTKNTKFYCG